MTILQKPWIILILLVKYLNNLIFWKKTSILKAYVKVISLTSYSNSKTYLSISIKAWAHFAGFPNNIIKLFKEDRTNG